MGALLSCTRGTLEPFQTRKGYVWIVQHDESPHDTILGVFGDEQSASDYADLMGFQFPKGGSGGSTNRVGLDVQGERYHG